MQTHIEAQVGRRLRKSIETALTAGAFLFAASILVLGLRQAGVFEFLDILIPIKLWALATIGVTVARGIFITINGNYAHTFKARQILSVATLGLVWLPLFTSFFMDMVTVSIAQDAVRVFPGIILAPLVAGAEVLVLFALTALDEASHDSPANTA